MWILFALAAAFFAAVNRTLMKGATSHVNDRTIVLWRNFFAAVPALALLIFIDIPEVGAGFYYAAPAACLLDVVAITFMSKSLRASSIGKSVPLLSFTPVFLLLSGWVILDEFPELLGLCGVVIIVAGSYILGCTRDNANILDPFRMISKDPGARYMLGAAACFAVAGPFFKKAVLSSSPAFCVALTLPLSTLFIFSYHMLSGQRLGAIAPHKGWKLLLALGICVLGVALTTNLAFATGLASYVVSMKRLSIVFNILLGAFFFKEKDLVQNLFAAAIMVAGAVLIALS